MEEAKKIASKQKITVDAVISEALSVGLLGIRKKLAAGSNASLKTFRGNGVNFGINLYALR